MPRTRNILIWGILAIAAALPILAAAYSPFLAYRQPAYIIAGFAGIFGMVLLLVQPLLASNALPGLSPRKSKTLHRMIGISLVTFVVLHVAGLWITSPPDVIDALLFRSPTPFSAWGVIAMWCVFVAALLAMLRRPMRLGPRTWRIGHTVLVSVTVTGSVVHALLIKGTMETVTKVVLCVLVLIALLRAVLQLKVWKMVKR